MPRQIKISFDVSGSVSQTILLNDDCCLTIVQIQDGLENGTIVTTIQEDDTIDFTDSGKVIGTVVNVDNECEYVDFIVLDDGNGEFLSNENSILKEIESLVRSFDNENGLPCSVARAVRNLIEIALGIKSSNAFIRRLDDNEGICTLSKGSADECWADILSWATCVEKNKLW